MENNPNMESFEKFIKQQSDDFRMYPSKRVWYSLYNNFHPSRKWPSISMCIVLLSALLMIGYLNTKTNTIGKENNSSALISNKTLQAQTSITNHLFATNNKSISNTDNAAIIDNTFRLDNKHSSIHSTKKVAKANKEEKNFKRTPSYKKTGQSFNIYSSLNKKASTSTQELNNTEADLADNINSATTLLFTDRTATNNSLYSENDESGVEKNTIALQKIYNNHPKNTINPSSSSVNISTISIFNEELTNAANLSLSKTVTNYTDKQWIENYALYNRPTPKKWKGKLAMQAYFTPSVTYRKLYNNTSGKNISGNTLATTLNNSSINNAVNQTPSIGLEAGLGLQYPILKGVKLTAGLQLNYTRFNISAFGNAHPSATTLVMNSEFNGQAYEVSRSTPYTNIVGLHSEKLHNQTYQLSLPLGAAIKLAGIDNIEWYAGATIQPTFVFAATSYLISTDRRNYVKENSMLNHFNMNAGFETYISFKAASGLTWQIGPQFRKQLFSTNSKQFSIEERLMGYGVKIGVSKKL